MVSGGTLEEIVEKLRRAVEDAKKDPARIGHENSANGFKLFDPKIALAMKEKLMTAHQRAMERKEAQELSECTFHPAITRRSQEIVAAKPHLLGSLYEPKTPPVQHIEERVPEINPVSRALASQRERTGPIHERLIKFAEICKEKIESKRAEKARKEEAMVTPVPQINRNSQEISRRRAQVGLVPEQTIERLTDFDIQMREARRQRQESLEEEKLRRATQPVAFLTDSSRRILERSATSPKSPASAGRSDPSPARSVRSRHPSTDSGRAPTPQRRSPHSNTTAAAAGGGGGDGRQSAPRPRSSPCRVDRREALFASSPEEFRLRRPADLPASRAPASPLPDT